MASNQSTTSVSNKAPTGVVTMLQSSMSNNTTNIFAGIFTVISISMFIWSFISMSNFTGSKDDWNLIKPQITKVLILTLIGTFGLVVAAMLFFNQNEKHILYFILIISCLSLGLSYSALAISAISS